MLEARGFEDDAQAVFDAWGGFIEAGEFFLRIAVAGYGVDVWAT